MTIARDRNEIALSCDSCSHMTDSYISDDFAEMMGDARNDGWIIHRKSGEWFHICPSCDRKSRKPSAEFKPR